MLAVSSTFVVECTNGYFRCVSRNVVHHKYLQDGVALYELDNFVFNFLLLLTILSGYMVDRNSYFGFANSNAKISAMDFFHRRKFMKLPTWADHRIGGKLYLSIKKTF